MLLSELLGTRPPCFLSLQGRGTELSVHPYLCPAPAPQLLYLLPLERGTCQEKGWSTLCSVKVEGVGDGDGSSFIPVSSGRLAPKPKPRQPASPQAAWMVEASPLTWSFVVFKALKRGSSNSSPLLGVYHVPGASHEESRSDLTTTCGWILLSPFYR